VYRMLGETSLGIPFKAREWPGGIRNLSVK